MSADALRTALASLDPEHLDAAVRQELRTRVGAFVDQAHAAHWPPERVLVELKQLARAAGYDSHSIQPDGDRQRRDEVMEDVVRWCIEYYYAPRPSTTH